MNPDPRAVVLVVAVSVTSALLIVALVVISARLAFPLIEGWCARSNARLLTVFDWAEDAGLPYVSKQRARALFLSKLSVAQRRSWFLRRRFAVVASSGRCYTVSRYRPFNVRTPDALFCVSVAGPVPLYDKLLAQKLLLECDEQLFLARANVRTFSGAWSPLMAAARARFPLAD